MTILVQDLVALIDAERSVRRMSRDAGEPYRYHEQAHAIGYRPPLSQYWCEHCVGYYGVPHTNMHGLGLCRFAFSAMDLNRQCACIDCVVAEDAAREEKDRD